MTSSPPILALAVLMALGAACHLDTPRSEPSAAAADDRASAASAPAARRAEGTVAEAPAAPIRVARSTTDAESEAPLDLTSVLDDEERRLLEADDATLTREQRMARAYAQRKLVMADPDHPLHSTLTRLEGQVASGEYATMAQDMWAGRAAFPDRDP